MNRFFPLSLAALAAATLLGGTATMAQPAPERSLTRADAQARAVAAFGRLDQNADGQLSAADRDVAARARFDAADADQNGQLSFAEAGAIREQRRELRADRSQARREARGEPMMRGMRGPGPREGRIGGRMGAGQMLEGADADSNGTVSQAEFASVVLARFDRADANSDGSITGEEHRNMRGMGRRAPPPAPR